MFLNIVFGLSDREVFIRIFEKFLEVTSRVLFSRYLFNFKLILRLTLALLMAKVFANDHNATLAADDLALIANLLNAWLHLHLFSFLLLIIRNLN
jgi:hypothetical protein